MLQLSQTDAALLLGGFSSILLPFVHTWLTVNILPDWVKFIIAVLISAIGGFLTSFVSGQLLNTLSVIQTAALIGGAGVGIYTIAFRGLNLEKVLFPRAYVIAEAQKSVATQIGTMATQTIKDAVNPTSDTIISVRAEAGTYIGADVSPVQPRG